MHARTSPRRGAIVTAAVAALLLAAHAIGAERPRHQTLSDDDATLDGLDGSTGIALSPDGKHVYVTGSFDDAIATSARGPAGQLTFLGSGYDSDPGVDGLDAVRGIAVSPDGRHVYAASLFDDSVALFHRNPSSGGLTYGGIRVDNGSGGLRLGGAHGVAVSPDGASVYVVARSEDAITAFARDADTGALTLIGSHADGVGGVTGMDAAEGVTVAPDGRHVYVAAEGSDAVVVFERDLETGALTFRAAHVNGVGGVSGLKSANSVVVSRDGRHVYVAGEFDDGTLGDDDLGAVFARDTVTGALTFLEAIPPFRTTSQDFDCLGVSGGGGIAIDATGDRVYVTESWHSSLLVFARDRQTGRLTAVEQHCEFLSGLGNVNQVVVSADGEFVYTTGLDGSVVTFGPNRPPVVAVPLEDRTVFETEPGTPVDLRGAFADSDGDDLRFTASHDRPDLFDLLVEGSTLTIHAQPGATGSADVTVTAADAEDLRVSDVLRITIVEPPPFRPTRADVRLVDGEARDSASIRGVFPRLGKTFDPRGLPASIAVGDPAAPVEIRIPADDPGWRGRKGKWTWRSARGALPRVKLTVDGRKGTFKVVLKKLDLSGAPDQAFTVQIATGGESIDETVVFDARKKGRFRYRP